MNTLEDLDMALLIDRASQELAESLRPRFREFEREQDRLIAELRVLKRQLLAARGLGDQVEELKAELLVRDRRLLEVSGQAERWAQEAVQLEQLYTLRKRPVAHDHGTDAGDPPVIIFDLHRTLTPAHGFPLMPPWPGVKEALDKWASQGICLHLCTGALDPTKPSLILAAREQLTWRWIRVEQLPISFVAGKVNAHIYYDDRMVRVPPDGDWKQVVKGIEAQLAERTELGKDGIRRLIDLPDVGTPITDWPDPARIPPDLPRGYSTPILDVDVHRCLSEANSSTREAALMPGAKEALKQIWEQSFGIHLSCAGWDPSTHTPEEAARRLAGLRQMAYGLLGGYYDEFVSKDHGTVFVDDKGVAFTGWKRDLPVLLQRLGTPQPDDELTGPLVT